MKTKLADKVSLSISIIGFLFLAISFLLMPLDMYNENINSSTINIVSGLCFWLSLIIGCVAQVVLSARRKKWCSIYNMEDFINRKSHLGIISFFKNRYAQIMDVLMIVSVIGCAVALIATKATGYICYVFIALVVFSFSMHCILNGRNFYYVTNQGQLLSSLESNYKKKEK